MLGLAPPLVVGGVGQAKLQQENNWPKYYGVILFFHSRAIDDYHGVVAQRSACQGARRSYAARAPFPCHERVALARVFALASPLAAEVISSSALTHHPPSNVVRIVSNSKRE